MRTANFQVTPGNNGLILPMTLVAQRTLILAVPAHIVTVIELLQGEAGGNGVGLLLNQHGIGEVPAAHVVEC